MMQKTELCSEKGKSEYQDLIEIGRTATILKRQVLMMNGIYDRYGLGI